jgi:hypothetical protein
MISLFWQELSMACHRRYDPLNHVVDRLAELGPVPYRHDVVLVEAVFPRQWLHSTRLVALPCATGWFPEKDQL